MSRLGTTFATLLERAGLRDSDELRQLKAGHVEREYTEEQLNQAKALGIAMQDAEPWFDEEAATPMGERVAFDPLDIEHVIAKHRVAQSLARGCAVLEGCSCGWQGASHVEHLAGLITALAQPVPEVIRQTLTAVEIRLFGAYLIDPITGVDSAKQRQKIWETT